MLYDIYPLTLVVGGDKLSFTSREELLAYFSEVMEILEFEKTALKVNNGNHKKETG